MGSTSRPCIVSRKSRPNGLRAHHEQVTRDLRVEGVQLDEMYSKLRRRRVEWLHTAIAMGSLLRVVGALGAADPGKCRRC